MKWGYMLALCAALVLVLCSSAFAVTPVGHIKLLAAYTEDDEFKGSPADLQLEIKEGSGRVFLETIPLAKVDTQISTRFAKEIACKFAEVDCTAYDFFYTIKSPAGIVGGPSAGGAIATLTVAQLLELDVDQDTAMTGTINSGDLIGSIGSLKEKIDAAAEMGVERVVMPAVQEELNLSNNMTAEEYGDLLGVEVIGVTTLAEAVQVFTGSDLAPPEKEITVPEVYTSVMEDVARQLCSRTEKLVEEVDVFDLSRHGSVDFDMVRMQQEIYNLTEKGEDALAQGKHYSAASYCFGANVKANTLIHKASDMDNESAASEYDKILENIREFDTITEDRKKETIADLQTYMIVKERILEARNHLMKGGNDSESFGYATERLHSAESWSEFFGTGQKKFDLDEENLRESCMNVLMETDERFQYLNLFFPGLLNDLRNDLQLSHSYYEDEEYALCIYLASRTKAEANVLVTMLGVKEEVIDDMLELKLNAAKRAINRQTDNEIFPIIAYSYYEYASSLAGENDYAALIYAEYALELADIDVYFEKERYESSGVKEGLKEYVPTFLFVWGLILGFLFCWVVLRRRAPATKKAPEKKKAAPRRAPKGKTGLRLR